MAFIALEQQKPRLINVHGLVGAIFQSDKLDSSALISPLSLSPIVSLGSACRHPQQMSKSHSSSVNSVAFSADADFLASPM